MLNLKKGFKNEVTASAFLNWYFSETIDAHDIGYRVIESLKSDGVFSISARQLFDECGYIPKYICIDNTDAEGVDYDPTEVELIRG